jgi:hypothetical protein
MERRLDGGRTFAAALRVAGSGQHRFCEVEEIPL